VLSFCAYNIDVFMNICNYMISCRNIREPANVHLLYDILDFKPKEIEQAVKFCTNNALVCESQEDANRVAYDLEPGQRFDVSMTALFLTGDRIPYYLNIICYSIRIGCGP